ncbi:hypothetical protein BKE38_03110 [Pseudoroseomonas deserti]|uniref:Uncharacterized protein n=1 Tax=Teichococcus deserti TaxID=1817963 RepID=A0A1V2H7Z9_9PROT|nr:DUF6065 family protein [Pseudoroseomonas deserti]ONG58328.1 hypothetical protein BKE38_03110 [Pseudoroseomonas deserti]
MPPPRRAAFPLTAYALPEAPLPPIRPASPRRGWMDATPGGFAYRCLPLTIANAHGWEIQTQCGVEAWWNGGPSREDVSVRVLRAGGVAPVSHFGAGVLTFPVPALLRCAPGQALWVGGPPNAAKDGIAPLTGIVEADWAPMTFTMNWRFTRPDHVVRFAPGETVCFFFPLDLSLALDARPETRPLAAEPSLAASHAAWRDSRRRFNIDLHAPQSEARRQGWQRDYTRGEGPEGARAEAHLTRIRLRPFPPPPAGA